MNPEIRIKILPRTVALDLAPFELPSLQSRLFRKFPMVAYHNERRTIGRVGAESRGNICNLIMVG